MAGTSKSTEKLVNVIVCVGAAVVIFGAWAKILHKSFADIMLTVDFLNEKKIIIIYELIPTPDQEITKLAEALPKMTSGGNPALQSMDKMLQEAEINPANMKRLSESFGKLGKTVDDMTDIADMAKATGDYTTKTK